MPAAASLVPVNRNGPRVRAGKLVIPRGHAEGRVRVIVALRLPPLAAFHDRAFAAHGARRRLSFTAAASQRYLARVSAAQGVAATALRRAIPQARIGRRFQVVLDAMTVSLPATKLPQLARLDFVSKVYPTLRYRKLTDTSPSVIGADELQSITGARGERMKIGVVDDGVDNTNPFLAPDGLSYPPSFPRGGRKWTSPKVIVARAFPGPNSGRPGRLALDRRESFHGTHVAGIAAGDSGTCSPGGGDHPATCGLSGVAPRAYIGNYRVFNVPTPLGNVANTPEIAAAFEAAVRDGMDVINFSGGGAETEPANDALIDVVRNTAAAGVVPVIASGNDREDFGSGTVGSPGTAPDAITVAAVSNTHVFAPTLSVRSAPPVLQHVPIAGAGGARFPETFGTTAHRIVDIAARGVDRRLCGPDSDTNNAAKTPLAPGSLARAIALVSRGHCTFDSKGQRAAAAGAIGIVLVDNRPGEANEIGTQLPLPAGMISDLDGATLRAFLATTGGSTDITIGNDVERVETGRSGIVTSFSSSGVTAFGHLLKPDISAPGGQVLSSTLPEFTGGSPFAVFDGTSMATPHISGAAALLLQLHPTWTPQQVKSALVSTAEPAWANTARTDEAPVTLGGGGVAALPQAADPVVFTDPASLSFQDLNVNRGRDSRALVIRVTDAAGGTGTWQVSLAPQSTTAGATLDLPPALIVPPGGEADLVAVARAGADAVAGENLGFVLLRRGDLTRRIPYEFFVGRPQLDLMQAQPLRRVQAGDTRTGPSRVRGYCCPTAPLGPAPDYFGPAMVEPGAETLYVTRVNAPAANVGVAIEAASPGSLVDPWFLGAANERTVQGYAGTPVNVNELTPDWHTDVGAAGASFPKLTTFYVAVDSGEDPFTHRSLAGAYRMRSWVNDVRPPRVRLLTTRVTAGRPTIVARVQDGGAGVDPLSLTLAYRGVLVGASEYDTATGLTLFPLPREARTLPAGPTQAVISASDYQEGKNVNSVGDEILPNTAFKPVTIRGVPGPALNWILPAANQCVSKTAALVVTASSTRPIRAVRFFADGKQIDVDRGSADHIYTGSWGTRLVPGGTHVLRAAAIDSAGREIAAVRRVRVCR